MTRVTNRLQAETSPYLLQHASNPVDWYAWGEAAFARAKAEDKPILLSVGYSACHWCHVMAHESFEDEATARLMNELFVNVKVDREERPDVDAIYMNAVQAMTGAGGWPMTVLLTPEGEPFYGGTYFPPDDRYGRPSFRRVLTALGEAWSQRRAEVYASAKSMTQHLVELSRLPERKGDLGEAVHKDALTALMAAYDPGQGGFGGAPKFPPHGLLKYLLRRPEPASQQMVETTLHRMAYGGIYDQLGGGFARYSVDAQWLVPHFEKMLYDNAQLVSRYSEAFQVRDLPLYRQVVFETLAWVAREMTDAEGGFYSALDADSEGVEGKYYVWDEGEFTTLLGEEAELGKMYFGVSEAGNFEGKNILYRPQPRQAVAAHFNLEATDLERRIEDIKARLLAARRERVRPGLDDKILTSWNGLMLAAYAKAGRVFDVPEFIAAAIKNAEFVERELYREGRLYHSFKDGRAKIEGLLEDYALYALGLLELYRATFDMRWFHWAAELAERMREHFADPDGPGFFSTADHAEKLIVRPKTFVDSAAPSDNGAAAELFLKLARYTGRSDYESPALAILESFAPAMRKQPIGFGSLLSVLQWHLQPSREIALFGDAESPETRELLRVVNERLLPYTVVALSEGKAGPPGPAFPFMEGRGLRDGRPTAYVCEGGACKLPVTSAEGLVAQLDTVATG